MICDCMKWKLSELRYINERGRYEYVIEDKYKPIIQSFSIFVDCTNYDYDELIENLDRRNVNEFVNEGIIDLINDDVHSSFYPIYSPFLRNTILFGQSYDRYLRVWVGDNGSCYIEHQSMDIKLSPFMSIVIN